VCAAATGAAAQGLYGKMAGVAYEDYAHANLIVVWGANPSASGMHLVPFIREARKRGARLAVVDPRSTALARQADLHVRLRPGTDLPVALALHRHLFEEGHADAAFLAAHATGTAELRAKARPWTFERAGALAGVDPALLERLAELYVAGSPAVVRCGWGLERNRNGGSAVAAVIALPAVAGKFGVRGGGYTLSNSGAWGVSAESWARVPEPRTRVVNMNHLGRALTEYDAPPVKALFVYNANPAVTIPDQNRVLRGLAREDLFTVVFEQVLTDTAKYADVLLPATTFLEHWDLARGYGAYNLQLVRPVIDAVGDARPNAEVFSDLAGRLGLTPSGEVEAETAVLLRVTGAMPEAFQTALMVEDRPATLPEGRTPVQFLDVYPNTPDRRVHLHPEGLDRESPNGLYAYQPDPGTPLYPLALISPASEKTVSSTLGELRAQPAAAYMHADDAATRAIEDGDTVRILNALGEVECRVIVGDAIAPGTVSLPKGLWRRSTFNQATATALAPDTLTDLGAGACFNDARVEVVRLVAARLGEQDLAMWVGDTPAPGAAARPS
jgi:anaerobic selenocysteine-containing dehydrogenase